MPKKQDIVELDEIKEPEQAKEDTVSEIELLHNRLNDHAMTLNKHSKLLETRETKSVSQTEAEIARIYEILAEQGRFINGLVKWAEEKDKPQPVQAPIPAPPAIPSKLMEVVKDDKKGFLSKLLG